MIDLHFGTQSERRGAWRKARQLRQKLVPLAEVDFPPVRTSSRWPRVWRESAVGSDLPVAKRNHHAVGVQEQGPGSGRRRYGRSATATEGMVR